MDELLQKTELIGYLKAYNYLMQSMLVDLESEGTDPQVKDYIRKFIRTQKDTNVEVR
jgi:hypothetical protein